MSTWNFEQEFEIDNDEYFAVITVNYSGYEIPAKLSGHPDNWHPAEGEEELELVTMHLINEEGVVIEIDDDKERINKIWLECYDEILKELQERVA